MVGGRDEGRTRLATVVAAAVLVALLVVGLPLWLMRDGADGPGGAADEPGVSEGGDCVGTLRAVEVRGDLSVPRGEKCRLLGVAVLGHTTVGEGATLYARSSVLGEGLTARGHERVTIVEGRVPSWKRDWPTDRPSGDVDAVIEDGRHVLLRAGTNTDYLVRGNTGRVEIRGIYFDLGSADCRGNTREPLVRGIRAENPGVLQGQCAGLRNFGPSGF